FRSLGAAGGFVCFCPSTEAHLADGIGPSVELRNAGARLSLGTDSNTVIDMFTEARALEMHERLRSLRRGSWSSEQLWAAACAHDSLGFGDAPALQLRHTARTAGASEPLWAATADNVVTQLDAGDVAAELQSAIDECWSRVLRRYWSPTSQSSPPGTHSIPSSRTPRSSLTAAPSPGSDAPTRLRRPMRSTTAVARR